MSNTQRMEKLLQLLAREPNDSFLNFGLAMEYAKQERFDESLAQFEKTIALDPKYIAAYFHRGKTLVNKGDMAAAKTALEIGIAKADELGEYHSKSEMEELLNSL